MDSPVIMLASEDWTEATSALPMLEQVSNIKDQFKIAVYPDGGPVTSDGLYVVLEGQVSLRLLGVEVGKALSQDFFFEEYLVLEDIITPLNAYALPGTRLLKLNQANWRTLPPDSRNMIQNFLFGDLINVHMHDFQQPINCCNITAAAFSLTALGFPTHVDDIFRDCDLPTAYVVNSGLTLGEMYDVACTYIHRRGLKDLVNVDCHYFDEDIFTEQHLLDAIAESEKVGGQDDILVANFGVGIAHANETDGGHFALIAKCNQSTGIVHMVDVHPEKYGKMWVTNTDRLYRAMAQRDSSSLRSRGLLRFSARDAAGSHLSSLARPAITVDMTAHLDVGQSVASSYFSRTTTNLNSLTNLALALRLIGNSDVDADDLMRAARISHTEALSYSPTTDMLAVSAQRYLSGVGSHGVICQSLTYDEDSNEGENAAAWFRRKLHEASELERFQLVFNIDVNKVLGCVAVQMPPRSAQETAVRREFWVVCSGYDPETDTVTLADTSSATSQFWQAPLDTVFSGLEDAGNPAMVSLRGTSTSDDLDIEETVATNPLVFYYSDADPWSTMLHSVLANIGVTDLLEVNLSGVSNRELRMKQQLIAHSGKDGMPYLYFKGECLGEVEAIMQMIQTGQFQELLHSEGLPVLMKTETPSLDRNIFGYPKGGLVGAPDDRKNILVCCCGSSAADKIPELVERLVNAGHDVKLIPSKPAEHFFRDFGMERILKTLKPSDIYRDDDEWNFRYTKFGMPVRAAHLALCDWADCVVVAPITCNTMGKIAAGVADSLLTSVFVAWQYQRKPVVMCPACNTHMWNNLTTQNNVAQLKRLGCHFEGPMSGLLSNGTTGTGIMASVDDICNTVNESLEQLEHQEERIMRWGAQAAASDDYREWARIFRSIDEAVVGINIRADETGDTLLHYAAGGEGRILEDGIIERGVPDLQAAADLIKRGIDVDASNDYQFTPLHVAIMNDSADMVRMLLEAGADASRAVAFARHRETDPAVMALLDAWANTHVVIDEEDDTEVQDSDDDTVLMFSYGSLKRGFPNHDDHADALSDFVGEAVTRQAMPLIVPHEPNCSNPNCPWLHRMPALVNLKGRGEQVHGEVFRVSKRNLAALDELEGYHGIGHPDNVYLRKTITVLLNGVPERVLTYCINDAAGKLAEWDSGSAEAVADYTLEMAAVTPKP